MSTPALRRRALLAICLLAGHSFPVLAQEKGDVRITAIHGALLARSDAGWKSLAPMTDAPADKQVVALFGADFRSADGAVEGKVLADIGQRGPFPVLETAVRFHVAAKADLAVTLDHGVLILVNARKAGAARVELRVSDETFDVLLSEPKTKLGIEVYGRHLPGPPKLNDLKANAPVTSAAFFVLEGEAVVTAEKHATRLHAPPGNALCIWDNRSRRQDVHRFETLPDSVKPMTAEEKKQFEAIAGYAKKWCADPARLHKAVWMAAHSADALERKAAVVALGALDDYSGLVKALDAADHADARDTAILVLRHWLGEGPGQSLRMYDTLTKTAGYTPTQAKNFLHLCNGFEEERLGQPETYDLLISALNHPRMAGRELARWHLIRLAPAGRDIVYDAAAPEADRLKAIAAWRRLIPEGQLPPPPKKAKSDNPKR